MSAKRGHWALCRSRVVAFGKILGLRVSVAVSPHAGATKTPDQVRVHLQSILVVSDNRLLEDELVHIRTSVMRRGTLQIGGTAIDLDSGVVLRTQTS